MKLKNLQLFGFKSFIEKTNIHFPPGISAIVGPNGCGKSNVVDALRWVMGEQSVKQLRGKSMEDVIFAGADEKAPLSMAEVSLTLANDNGTAPLELKDYSEIMITRRLHRSGESEYYLNKNPCRLKDIHNIFMGSGMGARTYAVIQQGNIGAITDAGPDERRVFIEEAAGITRYKSRKVEALRKIDATHHNLARLSDLLTELKRQMGGLKRQARKAEIYHKYQARIRESDILITLYFYDMATAEIEETDRLLKDLQDKDIAYITKLKRLDAAVESIKLQRGQKSQAIAAQKNQNYETQRQTDRTEADLAHTRQDVARLSAEIAQSESRRQDLEHKNKTILSEMAQVEKEKASLDEDLARVKSRLNQARTSATALKELLAAGQQKLDNAKTHLMDLAAEEARYQNICQNATQNKEGLTRRLQRLGEEKAAARKQVRQLQNQQDKTQGLLSSARTGVENLKQEIARQEVAHTQKNKNLGAMVKQAQTLEFEQNKARTRFLTLKKMEENFEWYKDGVRAVMQARDTAPAADARQLEGVLGIMADIIEPKPSYATAVEAALGEALQYILVENQQTGLEAIDYLQSAHAGRSGFIPVAQVRSRSSGSAAPSLAEKRLLNYVRIADGYERIAEPLLGHVLVTDTLQEALDIWNLDHTIQTIVTKNGDIISEQGFLVGGSNGTLAGILAKKHELKSLQKQIEELGTRLKSARESQHAAEAEARELEIHLQKLSTQKNKAVQDEIEAEKALYKVSEALKNAHRHLDILRLEEEQLLGEEIDIDQEMAQYHVSANRIAQDVKAAQQKVSEISDSIKAISAQWESHNQKIVDDQLKQTAQQAGLENRIHTLRRLQEFHAEGTQQVQQITQEISRQKARKSDAEQNLKDLAKSLDALYTAIKQIDAGIQRAEADYTAIDAQLKENDGIILNIQSHREKTLEKTRLLELEQSQRLIKRENLENRLRENHHTAVSQARAEFRTKLQSLEDNPAQVEDLEQDLVRLKKRIDNMIDINLGAIKEFERLQERYQFLSTQREDLCGAIEDLHKVIKKINRITKAKFLQTFDLINAKLDEVFPRLFEGGTAKLMMTEPEKPLDTGIEFMIHPPGKKLTRMSLLSGGEKALSAIALIFSIYLIKPASFCLMDEIDAPLDDINVLKFNDLLQLIGEKSQIVMVTHNKKTMEFAQTLFGITMEKKGISKVVSVNLLPSESQNGKKVSNGAGI